jgi:hypothetical protein
MEKMSREEKYEYWTLVVEEFESNDKSIRSQCRANDIPFAQYYDWRKKIKTKESELCTPETFLEVAPVPLENLPTSELSGVSLEYCQDYHIRLSAGFNPSVLSSVLQVLRTSCSQ